MPDVVSPGSPAAQARADGKTTAMRIIRRVYLGPTSNPVRKLTRATLLGLLTLSVISAPVSGGSDSTTAAPRATAAGHAATAAPGAPTPTARPETTTMPPAPAPPSVDEAIAAAPAKSALAVVGTLVVKGRAPKTGYSRAAFGQAWADTDRDGCDTRNQMLRRDLTNETFKPGTRNCVVLTGQLDDPFSGRTIAFRRGQSTSTAVQVDHAVSLSDSWQKGAQQWPARKRLAFANDPLNLLVVDGSLNAQKGDGDAATWLPPNKAFRCAYVARQVAVKAKYRIWITRAERDAIVRVLTSCSPQTLPRSSAPTFAPIAAPQAPTKTTAPSPTSRSDPQFGTCRSAIAAGYGPYRRGSDPEYNWYDDRDSDGVVCER